MIQKSTLGTIEAQLAIETIKSEMLNRGKHGVIAVVDLSGDLIAFLRLDDAALSSIQIAMNKAWSVIRARKPTVEIGKSVRNPEKGFDISYYGDPRIVGWGGGVPVVVNGAFVGAVAVSGLPESEDIELAELGVSAINTYLSKGQ